MNANDQEKYLLEKVQDLLDEGAEDLNRQTRQRLENVRMTALRAAGEKYSGLFTPLRWKMVGGFFAAMMAAAAFFFWPHTPPGELPVREVDDFEIIASRDHIDFYQNLDFYQWLAIKENDITMGKAS